MANMDDPWAAGPSWSTPAKPSSSVNEDERDLQRALTPPTLSGPIESDPWGNGPSQPIEPVELKHPIETSQSQYEGGGGWGSNTDEGGWAEEVTAEAPSQLPDKGDDGEKKPRVPSPRAAADAWVLNSPKLEPHDSYEPHAEMMDHAQKSTEQANDIPLPASPSHSSPSQPYTHSFRAVAASGSRPHSVALSDQEEAEQAFADSLPTSPIRLNVPQSPKSPTSTDGGFGGFSSALDGDDPWGGGRSGAGPSKSFDRWGDANAFGGSPVIEESAEDEQEEGEEEQGWGGVPTGHMTVQQTRTAQDDDWEEAQRFVRLQAERAPPEKIDSLKTDWREVATTWIGTVKLDNPSQEESDKLEQGVSRLEGEITETLRSMGSLPSDVNTYPIPVSSLIIHERHKYALSRPSSTASTSLLNVSLAQRSRRVNDLNTSSPWLSRSRLGEPEAPTAEAAVIEDDSNKSKWSFWNRKAPTPKPLVTSGGGILEVKSPPIQPDVARLSGETKRSLNRTRTPSVSSKGSRPSSPAPATMTTSISDDGGSFTSQTPQAGAAPSAVSRFLGRLGRKPSGTIPDVDSNDLELSADDFSYLQEVPSMSRQAPERGVGDLLSMDSDDPRKATHLDSLLAAPPAALPASQSRPSSRPPTFRRTTSGSSSGSGKFVAKMKPPPARDMDLLGGLDFLGDSDDASTPLASPPPTSRGANNMSNGSGSWMHLLDETKGPAPAKTRLNMNGPSTPAPPLSRNASNVTPQARQSTPSFVLTPSPEASTAGTSMASINLDDDFGTPPKPPTFSSYDDFGDFSAFESALSPVVATPTVAPPQRSIQNHLQSPAALDQTQSNFNAAPVVPSIDHSSTLSLLNGASASKGKRWPAPPSPIAPILEPPPKTTAASAGFPFLSPPPAPRPASRQGANTSAGLNMFGEDLLDGAQMAMAPQIAKPPTPSNGSKPANPGLAGPPAASTLQPKKANLSTGQGLTASDLSFFDSL